jgi:hypothetical protein
MNSVFPGKIPVPPHGGVDRTTSDDTSSFKLNLLDV